MLPSLPEGCTELHSRGRIGREGFERFLEAKLSAYPRIVDQVGTQMAQNSTAMDTWMARLKYLERAHVLCTDLSTREL